MLGGGIAVSMSALLELWLEYAPAINTAGILGIAGLALALIRQLHTAKMENRKVTIDENKELREGLSRELENLRADTSALRAEIAGLRTENLALRDEYRKSETSRRELIRQVGQLKEANAELTAEIRRLYSFIDGIRREEQQRGNSKSAILLQAFPPDLVPAEIKRIIEDGPAPKPRRSRRAKPASQ